MAQPVAVSAPKRMGRRRRNRRTVLVFIGVLSAGTLTLLVAMVLFFFMARPLIGNSPPVSKPGVPTGPGAGSGAIGGTAGTTDRVRDPATLPAGTGGSGGSAGSKDDGTGLAADGRNSRPGTDTGAVGTVSPPPPPAPQGPLPRPITIGQADPRLGTSLFDPRRSPPAHILLLGVDSEGDRADALLLLRAEPDSNRLSLLALPRDTLAPIALPGSLYPTWDKVGHASAYRDRALPGRERARQTVEALLGVRVHRYLAVNLDAFITVVDAMGGVTMDVPFNMQYEDPYQNLRIDIPAGRQRLTGLQAMGLVRWRQGNDGQGYGDLGRVRMQQSFLAALFAQLQQPGSQTFLLPRLPQLLSMMESDLTLAEASALANLARKAQGQLELYTLPGAGGNPGTPGYGYYFADEANLDGVLSRWAGKQAR